jgi:pimeloyl-ACP methyl ester carboxylesterase
VHETQLLRVPIADAEVSVLAIGAPTGRPVVLIPGLSDGLAPVEDDAARALYACAPLPLDRTRGLVVAHRAPVRPGMSTLDLAADLRVVLDHLLDRPAVLVAHSLGGMVAQHLAATAPELVAGLVLTACAGHDATSRLAAVTAPTLVLAGDCDALVDLARSRALAEALTAARFEVLVDLGHGFPEQARGPFQARVARFLGALGWDGTGQ